MTRRDEETYRGATAQAGGQPRAVRSEVVLMWAFSGAGALLTLASALLT